ncbi:MAG: hypothetical protein ACLGIN_03200, partial [Candidatus Sericytochromatia bacterium]
MTEHDLMMDSELANAPDMGVQYSRDQLRITGARPFASMAPVFIKPERPQTQEEKLHLAGSPLADESTWFKLIQEQDLDIQITLARNPKATLNVLELIARTGAPEAQVAVASHPQITASLLAVLASSPHPGV